VVALALTLSALSLDALDNDAREALLRVLRRQREGSDYTALPKAARRKLVRSISSASKA
jgi:hypothetical protein